MTEESFMYEAHGKEFSCSYEVSDGEHPIVEVFTPWGSKRTQQGGSPALTVARMMAGELYMASKSKS